MIKNYFVSRHEFCFNLEIMEQNCNTFGTRSIPSIIDLGCIRLTVFRNRITWNTSYKSFVFTEIHIKNVKHLLKCYFKHIFIILVASKRQTYRFEFITSHILIPEYSESNAPLVSYQSRHLLRCNCFSSNGKHCRNKN